MLNFDPEKKLERKNDLKTTLKRFLNDPLTTKKLC